VPLGELAGAVGCSSGGGLVAIGSVTGRLNVWEVRVTIYGNKLFLFYFLNVLC